MTWLPLWRTFVNPRRSSARTTSAPDTRGSLGMRRLWNRERGDEGMAHCWQRELGKVKGCGLAQVGYRLFNRLTLRSCPRFRIEGDEAAFFGVRENCGEFHSWAPGEWSAECRSLLWFTPGGS